MANFYAAALAAILWTALGASGTEPLANSPVSKLVPGTLLFLENCNSVVQWSTRGSIAHVALAMTEGDKLWVYEATPGAVRKVLFSDYLVELARLNKNRSEKDQVKLVALLPGAPYTPAELAVMQQYLDDQLGRRYSIKSYVRSKPYDGIHCAELASTTLSHSGRYELLECHKIHPQALFDWALTTHKPPLEIELPVLDEKEPWTARLRRCWSGWTNWCAWSCREAWLFL